MDYGPQDLAFLADTPGAATLGAGRGLLARRGSGIDVDLATGSNRSGLNEDQRLWKNTQRIVADLLTSQQCGNWRPWLEPAPRPSR